ncbi:hypothetical protein ACIGXM_15725 [Kitasatospora sp. NPDC052896]|uniref:hypothetical protein n=1 Tax=Kitasatospora sp. NPDC052896 TaxID=3364061 RepID=UPI0037C8437E
MRDDYTETRDDDSAEAEPLSTEDIAHPRRTTAEDPGTTTDTDDTSVTADERPRYPGEAAPTGGEDRAAGEGEALESARPSGEEENRPLLAQEDAESFRTRWQKIQTEFVDDPKEAVRSADALVAEVMRTLATSFAEHKDGLEGQWDRGEDIVTEDLRIALQRYRSFFNRLLTT